MKNLTKEQWMGVIRHALTFVGGLLIASGQLDDAVWSEITGSALSLIGAIWSVAAKTA